MLLKSNNIPIGKSNLTPNKKYELYLEMLKKDFTKICKIEFLYPDNTTSMTFDNNYQNKYSVDFIQNGNLTVNNENGQRRVADISLSNERGYYDFDVNKIWIGQQIRLSEGLILPNGEEYYLPQGVFYIRDPTPIYQNANEIIQFPLLDKWSYLNRNLNGIYEVPVNENIYKAVKSILDKDRGNGLKIDNVVPLFTNYYDGKTTTLTDGTIIPILNTPYTARKETNYADIILEMAGMLVAKVGYNQNGQLELTPSQNDVIDSQKPVIWNFKTTESEFLGITYNIKTEEIYNQVIVHGSTVLSKMAKAIATNNDIKSPTNVKTIGLQETIYKSDQYVTDEQCFDVAKWMLRDWTKKRMEVTIECTQMFHIYADSRVTLTKSKGIEDFILKGFTRPLAQQGAMSLYGNNIDDSLINVTSESNNL